MRASAGEIPPGLLPDTKQNYIATDDHARSEIHFTSPPPMRLNLALFPRFGQIVSSSLRVFTLNPICQPESSA
jgi:hypothetical protein